MPLGETLIVRQRIEAVCFVVLRLIGAVGLPSSGKQGLPMQEIQRGVPSRRFVSSIVYGAQVLHGYLRFQLTGVSLTLPRFVPWRHLADDIAPLVPVPQGRQRLLQVFAWFVDQLGSLRLIRVGSERRFRRLEGQRNRCPWQPSNPLVCLPFLDQLGHASEGTHPKPASQTAVVRRALDQRVKEDVFLSLRQEQPMLHGIFLP